MASRTALRRDRIARAVLRGARNHVTSVSTELQERLEVFNVPEIQGASGELTPETAQAVATLARMESELQTGEMPDWSELQSFFGWMLAAATRRYLVLDDRLQQTAAENWVPRDRRDQAVEDAFRDMIAVRRYVSGVLDERAANSLLGLDDRTATQPDELRTQMESAIRRLKSPESHVPKPRIEGLEADWESAVRQLERGLENLDTALEELADETLAVTEARREREEALAMHRDAVTSCRSVLRGLYVLAGRRDLTGSLRSPFGRRLSEPNPEADDFNEDDFADEGEDVDEEVTTGGDETSPEGSVEEVDQDSPP